MASMTQVRVVADVFYAIMIHVVVMLLVMFASLLLMGMVLMMLPSVLLQFALFVFPAA